MMMNKRHALKIWAATTCWTVLAGCAGGGSSTLSNMVDAIDGVKKNTSPFVEGYIQYPGAPAKWAGPVLWTIHVTARDGQVPQYEVTPALPVVVHHETTPAVAPKAQSEVTERGPASTLAVTTSVHAHEGFSAEKVREQLGHLAEALASSEKETQACSSSVKVRLTRADGSIVEKQGCRGVAVWSQLASEMASEYMGLSRTNTPVAKATEVKTTEAKTTENRAPASAPTAVEAPASHDAHGAPARSTEKPAHPAGEVDPGA